jgi:cyanobactin maturation PatA/PatG family protease
MNARGVPFDFSNWGKAYETQGILTLGENILSAVPGGGTALKSGTSYATAIVSGIVALLLSLQVKQGDKPDPAAVRAAILQTAQPCKQEEVADCRRYLAGSLNIPGAQALIAKQQGGTDKLFDPTLEVLQPSEAIAAVMPTIEPSDAPAGETPQAPPAASGEAAPKKDCGCNGGAKMELVYAIGSIGYDFGTEARRDSLVQDGRISQQEGWNPNDPRQLLENLDAQPWEAASLIWTLNQEETEVYAIQPAGPYAPRGFEMLRQFLREQLDEGVERVSIPGYAVGSVKLMSGQSVPRIVPTIRGMYSWSTNALISSVLGGRPAESAAQEQYDRREAGIRNFLDRIYYELRNLGKTPQERAINYASTNAFQIAHVFQEAVSETMQLDKIDVEKSPLCRPESDCWDVKLLFFDPQNRNQRARKVYRFTVDVSNEVPVTIGRVRSWYMY